MLYLIGLGLGDAKDVTLKGLEIIKNVDKVYLENYTSILGCDQKELEELYGRSVIVCDRDMMEQGCEEILITAKSGGAAVLVVGDPLNATTHTDLLLRAAGQKIPYQIIHNASIINAVACCGLQIYNFGETVSIPFWTETWKPESYFDKIMKNRRNGLHTLCLLDIKVKEPNLELLVKGIKKTDPPRFMSFSEAALQLVSIIKSRKLNSENEKYEDVPIIVKDKQDHVYLEETSTCVGLARVGSSNQKIVRKTLIEATTFDLGAPLHSLVIPSNLHPLEEEMLELFSR